MQYSATSRRRIAFQQSNTVELGGEHHRLQRVEPAVGTEQVVVVWLPATRPWSRIERIRAASPASEVVTAPASPNAPRFLPG